uniref:Si:ch211-239d6.2 n=1 Tax=Cyprinus carpio TaxID=7962 RepID=A0A8C2EJ64_CYPCA
MFSEMQRARADMLLVRRKYKRYSKHKMTYLGLIACVIHNAPEKKLTFYELMNAVRIFVDGDRKGLENNIRVCLSSNTCFVKVPINPECPNAKRNFWKVDESKITPKILRRHFGALRDVFPDFYENMEVSSVKNETENNRATLKRLEAEKKFTSPFSIESLLQRESSAPLRNRPALCATRNLENAFVVLQRTNHKNTSFTLSNTAHRKHLQSTSIKLQLPHTALFSILLFLNSSALSAQIIF